MGFYPAEETAGQTERYFESPEEDDITENGEQQIIHKVDMKETDRAFLTERVEDMAARIPELDKKLNEVAQGWKTRRMGKVELAILRQALYEMLYDN